MQAALSGVREMSIFNVHDKYWDRARETTRLLNEELGCRTTLYGLENLDVLKEQIYDSDLLANATEVGMTPQEEWTYIPDASFFKPGMLVTDVIYAPPKTKFLKLAEEAGCDIMNGFPMMLFQGAEAFRLWTGQDMPIAHMKEYLHI